MSSASLAGNLRLMCSGSIQCQSESIHVSKSSRPLSVIEILTMLSLGALLITTSWLKWLNINVVEAWGFVTGGVCVWLVARENIWNWPIGLLNNVFFFALFFRARLYADMSLQVVYFILGVYGWWYWICGGGVRSQLIVTRATRKEWLTLLIIIPICTLGFWRGLVWVNGAAPFADALTTFLSLAAQYLLCRKRIENWWFWIVADLIYIPLYVSRNLPLTSALYAVFLIMCVYGLKEWTARLRSGGGK